MRGANKYGAIPTMVDNIKFDSRVESRRYQYLKLLLQAGVITELETHPVFVLIDPFIKFGKRTGARKYKADFMYLDENGQRTVEDVKGYVTRDFPLRRTLFDSKYPDTILKVVINKNGRWEEK